MTTETQYTSFDGLMKVCAIICIHTKSFNDEIDNCQDDIVKQGMSLEFLHIIAKKVLNGSCPDLENVDTFVGNVLGYLADMYSIDEPLAWLGYIRSNRIKIMQELEDNGFKFYLENDKITGIGTDEQEVPVAERTLH